MDGTLVFYVVFKQRMQLSGCRQSLIYAKNILKSEGLSALFRSLPVTIVDFCIMVDD